MSVPKMQLDLDQVMDDQEELENISIADSAIADGVEDEKCVVGQYRTNKSQKQTFASLLSTCDRDSIPVEWVIDIADESNGWFYGTAYHFDDTTQMLHVMVPDKVNPTFDGQVQLDYRTVHLIECVDGRSLALFNKIVRDSVIKIKWDVEWYEEYDQGDNKDPYQQQNTHNGNNSNGQWIYSLARYYIRIANQLLVEDREFEDDHPDHQNSKGFVIITADLNVRVLHCHKNKGIEDFYRLINEGIVSFSPEAEEEANIAIQNLSHSSENPLPTKEDLHNNNKTLKNGSYNHQRSNQENTDPQQRGGGGDNATVTSGTSATPSPLSLKKLTEVVKHLKESLNQINEDYEKKKNDDIEISQLFQHFILSGDLEEGLQLMEYFQKLQTRHETRPSAKILTSKKSTKNLSSDDNDILLSPGSVVGGGGGSGGGGADGNDWEETVDDPEEKQYRKVLKLLEYAAHNTAKLEKQCVKLLKHGYEILNSSSVSSSAAGNKVEEYELLKKEYKKLKKELDIKEQELRLIKNNVAHSATQNSRR